MKCAQCHAADTKVIESRDVTDGQSIRRRRECTNCGFRFTTYERVERPQLVVIKNSGTRELFSREKLLAGLYQACEKTTVTSLELEQLVDRVEQALHQRGETEVPSVQIGELIMEELARLNEVAYVRFASVYRRFADIESFERALVQMKEKKNA